VGNVKVGIGNLLLNTTNHRRHFAGCELAWSWEREKKKEKKKRKKMVRDTDESFQRERKTERKKESRSKNRERKINKEKEKKKLTTKSSPISLVGDGLRKSLFYSDALIVVLNAAGATLGSNPCSETPRGFWRNRTSTTPRLSYQGAASWVGN
jgi:hypothetical protein